MRDLDDLAALRAYVIELEASLADCADSAEAIASLNYGMPISYGSGRMPDPKKPAKLVLAAGASVARARELLSVPKGENAHDHIWRKHHA